MTFVPGRGGAARGSSAYRTVVFWIMMIALAAVLWQMASRSDERQRPARPMSYSDFMKNVDQNNVASAKLFLSQSTAGLQGTLRQPAQSFETTVPKDVVPDLTERLRKQGVTIEVVERKEGGGSTETAALAAAVAVMSAVVVIAMKRRRSRPAPPSGTPPIQNQPLGD